MALAYGSGKRQGKIILAFLRDCARLGSSAVFVVQPAGRKERKES
jgi:hypothetical protein